MGKINSLKCALATKPVAWSNNKYKGPSSPKVSSGFVRDHGYGGEEWNNAEHRVFKGQRIFHTETKPKLNAYAENGNLGLIMTSWHNKRQYVVGVACGLRRLSKKDKIELARIFRLREEGNSVWQQSQVQERFGRKSDFTRHWQDGSHTISWACPDELYHWFEQPILLEFKPLGDKATLAKMHNSYQAILPEQGLHLLNNHLSLASPIRRWLIENEFDERFNRKKIARRQSVDERRQNYGSPTPENSYERYVREALIKVHPKHNSLEKSYRNYLISIGVLEPRQNDRGMDFVFNHPRRGLCIAELKPCETGQTRFAIRHALGQLLEYRYQHEPSAALIAVLSVQPTTEEQAYLKSLNMAFAWQSEKGFIEIWPDGS